LNEKTNARGFRKKFSFSRFNQETIKKAVDEKNKKAFAQDTTFSRKSGKKTFGVDKFWNGCASREEQGLEVSLISIVDLCRTQSFALSAKQTPSLPDLKAQDKESSRIDFYLVHLKRTQPFISKDVKYGLFDGFYAKLKFVNGVVDLGFDCNAALRCDADLRYLYTSRTKGARAQTKV
jgi:hypothetical protein